MKTSLSKVAVALSVFFLIAGVAFPGAGTKAKKGKSLSPAQADCSTIDDSTLANQVRAQISETPSLAGQHINVEAEAGVITLRGNVGSSGKKRIAGRVAARVRCVKRVVNLLEITKRFRDYECCCDGSCWIQSRPCPFCQVISKCSDDYKAAKEAAHGNKKYLAEAWNAFHGCICKESK